MHTLHSKTTLARVALVSNFPPPHGGISTHVERLRALLLANGYRVTVLDLYNRPRSSDPADVIRYGGWRPLSLIKGIWRLTRMDIDVVHFHVTFLRSFELAGPVLLKALPKN